MTFSSLNYTWKRLLIYLALFISSFLIYWPNFSYGFQTHWDDHWVVMNLYTEAGLNYQNITAILTEFYHGQYAPVNELYYTVLYSLAAYHPAVFHSACFLLHVANAILVYHIIKRLLPGMSTLSSSSTDRVSFVAALIFSVHPLMIESVAWTSASKAVLYSFFYLSSILVYLNYRNKKKTLLYITAIVLFLLSLGAKEQAVTLPVCLVLVDWTIYGNKIPKKIWWEKVPFFVISIAFGIITLLSQAADGEGFLAGEASYNNYQKIVLATYTISEYATKCLFPVNLSYLYPFPFPIAGPVPWLLKIYPFLLLLFFITFFRCVKDRVIIFGVLFFLVHILLVSNLVSLSRFAVVADRYSYMGNLGLICCIAYLSHRAIQRGNKIFQAALLTIYIGFLFFQSVRRVPDWQNSDTLKKEFRQNIKDRQDLPDEK